MQGNTYISVDAFMALKFSALYRLGCYAGMYGRLRDDPPPIPEGLRASLERRAVDPSLRPWQRAACALLLEFYVPGWRKQAPAGVLGHIVERQSREARAWARDVLRRAGHRCEECGATEGLKAHHIVPWAVSPELRVEPSNGRALCFDCHMGAHGWACHACHT